MQLLQLRFKIFYAYTLFPECDVSSNSLNNHQETYTHVSDVSVFGDHALQYLMQYQLVRWSNFSFKLLDKFYKTE